MNDGSRAAEQRERLIQDRMMTSLERGFTVRVARLLQRAANNAAEAAEEMGSNANIDMAIRGLAGDMTDLFKAHYTTTVERFGRRVLDAAKSHQKYETKADDVFGAEMRIWITAKSAEKVRQVTDTTKELIRGALAEGFEQNLAGTQLSKLVVEKAGGAIAKQRGKVIARTETHMAANHANMEAITATGIPVRKVWVSASDERTRDSHRDTDARSHENPLARDEMFEVGSDSMTAPGLGGDPAENINCRCVVGFKTD